MDSLGNYRSIIQNVLTPYTKIPYAHGELQCKAAFDRENDSYLLLTLGWDRIKRVHGCLVHIEIIDGKIWIQRDNTEHGVTAKLVAAGVPKDKIVLGFQPVDVRPFTEYAVN